MFLISLAILFFLLCAVPKFVWVLNVAFFLQILFSELCFFSFELCLLSSNYNIFPTLYEGVINTPVLNLHYEDLNFQPGKNRFLVKNLRTCSTLTVTGGGVVSGFETTLWNCFFFSWMKIHVLFFRMRTFKLLGKALDVF